MVRVKGKNFTLIFKRELKGVSVRVVGLPGCVSQGKNRKEAIENIRKAIEGCLEASQA
jgi:antitoxin HicB